MQTKALGTVDEIGNTVQQVGKQTSGQKPAVVILRLIATPIARVVCQLV